MLYNLEWLQEGQVFPPLSERKRIQRYVENELLFDGEHFGGKLRNRSGVLTDIAVYQKCSERIQRVIGNFEDVISFPVLLNYQRFMSLKMADLICGEYPTITGGEDDDNTRIKEVRDYSDLDSKLYTTVIDISRYGDALWRVFKDVNGEYTFTIWNPSEWYPIILQDGTNNIVAHVLCWVVNTTRSVDNTPPDYQLHVQIHWTAFAHADNIRSLGGDPGGKVGTYEYRVYQMDSQGSTIRHIISRSTVSTGLSDCAVFHIKSYSVSNSIYGYDDYMPLDSVLAEVMARIGQISVILDKHADPNITGPVSMLDRDPITGEPYLKLGKFWATSAGENEPKYMTWDGQLKAAFDELEFLMNQVYILSEMGAALLGGDHGASNVISGTAMRFKMVNALAKARRTANSMTLPVRKLLSLLTGGSIDYKKISVFWQDGLPDDPRENIENCKLATGEEKMMPLKQGIMEYFDRSDEEADQWIQAISDQIIDRQELLAESADDLGLTSVSTAEQSLSLPGEMGMGTGGGGGSVKVTDKKTTKINKPGPQNGKGVNSQKNGSVTGSRKFRNQQNAGSGDRK